MTDALTEEQWRQYESRGYLRLGKVLTDAKLASLRHQIDEIMLARAPLDYDRILMQLDREPGTDRPGPQSKGHKGATLSYRKIQDLEFDPHFLDYMRNPLFCHICAHCYGEKISIACFRAMFMNKPAKEGTPLAWHQDRWNFLDRDPLITIWTALDPVTVENGCLQIVSGAHRRLINPSSVAGSLTEEQKQELLQDGKVVQLELAAGECVLLHNHLPHSSGINTTEFPRRAFSVCYMDANTQTTSGKTYLVLFGDGAL
jgi:phytanoyl-CoA hydroxylase